MTVGGLISEECEGCARLAGGVHQQRQPDLRFIVSILKINNDLERVADFAVNIAEDVVYQVDGEIIRHGGIQS